ncbi:MAG: DUF1566 domain-containing protein, partial [Anaerolineales bacterium]|nr:DUF1566 domain-containing protein [Anaerolineales bacterium]
WGHLLKALPLVLALILLTTAGVLAATGTTDSTAAPGSTSSYTLEDIYNRLNTGTVGMQSTFTEPAVAPGTGTMHDLNNIMSIAPALDNTDGATAADVLSTKTFWGLTNGEWGLQTGSIASGSNVSGTDGLKTFTIPDGYYSGKTATCNDTDLAAGNIKSGVSVLGVSGTFQGSGCNCNSGTLNGTRWCDNGDGTVTDLLGYNMSGEGIVGKCVVWLKKADWGGSRRWRYLVTDTLTECSGNGAPCYDDAHARASIRNADYASAGLSDTTPNGHWRLPTFLELAGLTRGTDAVSSGNMRAFTGVQAGGYWSSTTDYTFDAMAEYVTLSNGAINYAHKDTSYYIWPVRGGQ